MTRLFVNMLCEQCGKPHGQLWGSANLNDPDVRAGLCFECKFKVWKKEKDTTTVYVIRPSGELEELASYCLPPKEALKCAWLHFVKGRTDTWNWDAVEAPIVEGSNVYSIDTRIGVLSVRK